ncbi:MCE family protein [Mycolicibacterium sp. CH28]|uniref:MCE family protein n=1 Tax=Mycolicibacterium sp. CH28 TaxID=2512237 RepID=UPI0010822317|nr:MCE family protein [Mycolicibacterium sp. CH28]TGD88574.1 MCE family protein [Mycolicibacterium sp. CH28]
MKPFSERNTALIGIAGAVLVAAVAITALEYNKLPFIHSTNHFTAYFAEAGGLKNDAEVQVAGYRVGKVTSIDLDENRVRITFDIDDDIHLGDRTEAAIKTKSLLGSKILEVSPRGDGQLTSAIPIDRTAAPYQLPDVLGDLSTTVHDLNTTDLNTAFETLARTFADTPPALQAAVQGVGRISDTLNKRDQQLRALLSNARKASSVLADHADQIAGLVSDSNALLAQLRTESDALEGISRNLSMFARQLEGFVTDNRAALKPALDKLNGVLTIVDNRKDRIQLAIKYLNSYAMSLGESVASGPFFMATVSNLLPGQYLQPFIDAAFSDLGLDPNVLLPSQLTDPQTGQRATPALPSPFPRTGQGGDPHLTLPDAITGNPGDPRYPYREPLPAPPPGGPPPGPPAVAPPGLASAPVSSGTPVNVAAPGEVPAQAPANSTTPVADPQSAGAVPPVPTPSGQESP